jgi:hypothetical protein
MVYLLETPLYRWDRVPPPGHKLVRKQIEGVPLQQCDIPVDPRLAGRFDVPDICIPTEGFVFVSDRGRAALEEFAPGSIAFFPINLKAPENMRPAKAYFFIDVLPRAQCIDWDRSVTGPRIARTPDGRESRALGRLLSKPSTKFKAITADVPKIWREADVDRPAVNFFANKADIFMRDELWEALNTRFPGQLVSRKLGEG